MHAQRLAATQKLFRALIMTFLGLHSQAGADWPMLRGSPSHSGYVTEAPPAKMKLAWAVEFSGERIGTAVEPIVAANRVFVSTHAGSLFALSATNGQALWRFKANGPLLHSPACSDDLVFTASADGSIYALDQATGKRVWQHVGSFGGYSAAPILAEGRLYIGSRSGEFIALDARDGHLILRAEAEVPIRQTAAFLDGKIFVTFEDLRLRCFDAASGRQSWISEPMFGQTARDYYPVVIKQGERSVVIIRTNPLLNMGQRIGRDRTLLCRLAGVDDSSWKTVDAWIKSDAARGTPELWMKEQDGVSDFLNQNPDAQSFYIFDATTGKQICTPPILWIAGCQGVGSPPTVTASGELLVFYRSAYGNWNHGVAPLVTLGLLNPASGRITPLFHEEGSQPPWNTFWGTADESQNFLVAGDALLIVHQGTLSRFNLRDHHLEAVAGNRDTFGGLPNPPWARNEWHGPARSGVALAGGKVFWQTGSRILCLTADGSAPKSPLRIDPANVPVITAPPTISPSLDSFRKQLGIKLDEILSKDWAPLFCDPGLAGRDFSFARSSDFFEMLAFAFAHSPADQQSRLKAKAHAELAHFAPFLKEGRLAIQSGSAREWFQVPPSYRASLGMDPQPHAFGGLAAAWQWARVADDEAALLACWEDIRQSFVDFEKLHWRLDQAKGDLYANRYIASLAAFAEIARKKGETELSVKVRELADSNLGALVAWWKTAAEHGTLRQFDGSGALDPFIGHGDLLSFRVAPHRHKIALFQDLSHELFSQVRAAAPQAVLAVWNHFSELYPTWHLQGEERQVHFGENFVDPPDLALGAFKVAVWLGREPVGLTARVDLPFSRADLYWVEKVALLLTAAGK